MNNLMQEDSRYNEEWTVVLNTGGKYALSKLQARLLQQEIANGNRGIIMFKTFAIPISYIAEFFRSKRFLKDEYKLPATTNEVPVKPISKEQMAKFRKEVYRKIGKKLK